MIRGPLTVLKVYHWSLAVSVVFSWLAADDLGLWHEYAGYVALALIAARIVWSLVGPKPAGLGRYTRGASKALAYGRDLLLGRGPRHSGVFPFAGLSVVLLLVTITATSVSGWLVAEPSRMAMLPDFPTIIAPAYASGYDDDEYEREGGFGGEAMEEIHEFLANFLLLIIFAHVALMVYLNTRKTNRRPNPPPSPGIGT